jgi:hypothetical protein
MLDYLLLIHQMEWGNGIRLLEITATQRLSINKRIAGSQTQLYSTTTDHVKVAIKWNGATADVFVNGTKVVNATSYLLLPIWNFLAEQVEMSVNI